MTEAVTRHPYSYVIIDGKPYPLAKTPQGVPMWMPRQFQTQEGDPTKTSRWRYNDWSRGMGDSRGSVRGAVEFATGVYLGSNGRILPGPAISEITTTLDATAKDIVEVTLPANRILAGGGTKVAEINPADHTVATTATVTGGVLSMQPYEDQVAIAVGDSVDYYVRAAAGTYSQNSISKKARAFGLSGSSLVRGYDVNWSKCDATEITTVNNWGTDYPIGGVDALITQVFSKNRNDYVLKEDGLWSFDVDDSFEANILDDLSEWKSAENRWVGRWFENLFICTKAGLYRFLQQGAARTVGVEVVSVSENELVGGYPTAFTAIGQWGYEARLVGTTTYILMYRRAVQGDANMGSPFTACQVIDSFTGECRAMRISNLNGTDTELYYGAHSGSAHSVRYFALNGDGTPKSYRTTGTMRVDFAPSDLGEPMTIKQCVAAEVYGYNWAAAKTVQIACAFDNGAFNNVDSALTSPPYEKASWTKGTNDSGRVVQPRVTLTNNSATVPPEVRDIILAFESRPIFVEGAVIGVKLRDYFTEGDITDRRTAQTAREDLEALLDGALVDIIDMWGETYAARLSAYEGDPKAMGIGGELQVDVAFAIRRLDYG